MNDYVTKIHLKEKEKYKLTRKNMNILGKSVPANFVSKNHPKEIIMKSFPLFNYFALLLILQCFISITVSITPPAPLVVGKKIYYIETYFKANWFRADQFCKAHGMTLATIEDKQENDELVHLLNSTAILSKESYWISGNDLAEKQFFVWGNGRPITYHNFPKGQPDNAGTEPNVEHCVELRGLWGLQWNDWHCNILSYFICERRIDDIVGKCLQEFISKKDLLKTL